MMAAPFSEKTMRLLKLASLGHWVLAVLLVLEEGRMSRTEIGVRLAERSDGQICLMHSSVDQALEDLLKADLVQKEKGGRSYVVFLTKEGRDELKFLASLGFLA